MLPSGRHAAPHRAMARRPGARPKWSRHMLAIAALAGLAVVGLVGTFHPLPVAGSQPAATGDAVAATSAVVGSVWNSSDPTGGLNWIDLVTKGAIVLALLFITLRVLGRMQAAAPKRGAKLEVLESRPLAPKASLHLVAIGDRRLVVGLTPSGMVSLAELDAGELEALEPAEDAEKASATGPAREGSTSRPVQQPTLGSAFDAFLGPVDALTGRLAGFLSGGRIR